MMRPLSMLVLVAALSLPATRLVAQDSTRAVTRDVPDSLVSKAKISEDSARAVALKRVPGTVVSTSLKSRKGKLAYAFEVQRSGRPGTTRVTVNAMNGHVVSVARVGSKSRRATRRSS